MSLRFSLAHLFYGLSLIIRCALFLIIFNSHAVFAGPNQTPATLTYKILQTKAHPGTRFTQGLQVYGDQLLESSGLYGESYVVRYDKVSGQESQTLPLPDRYFAEGIALLNGSLYCLTWQAGNLLVLDPDTLSLKEVQRYRGEGWGLTQWQHSLAMSNGSDRISFRDPNHFAVERQIRVKNAGKPVEKLNDLTSDGQSIYANVWQTSDILQIDPQSGDVTGILDLSDLTNDQWPGDRENVLNGVAWDNAHQGLWVTGKRWNKRYLIKVETPQD